MGCFLLNELGEVLLEVMSGLDFRSNLCLEVDEKAQTAVLKNKDKSYKIDFVHEELMLPLKMNKYLYVVEQNNLFSATKSALAKVRFIG